MSTSNRRRIRKLTYRDQGGAGQAAHQAHWRGFTFAGGDVIVAYVGPWGTLKVWAANEQEGRRVIGHACAIAGIPTEGAEAGEWVIATDSGGRNGRPGTFAVPEAEGLPIVSKRPGPSGPVYL